MKKEFISNMYFQTFFISKEQSNCPNMIDIFRFSKKLKDLEIIENIDSIIFSLRYGKRILINDDNSNFFEIKRENILEIVDYNPLKRILLAIGPGMPPIETPVHWIIHHARDDVNAICQINYKELYEKIIKKYPTTEKEQTSGTLNLAKEILKTLRSSKTILIKNDGVLFVGKNLKDIENKVENMCEDINEN
jgi:ribulose-5-phosphate 4-epimerase/fuculose-1-phosphate aldolase